MKRLSIYFCLLSIIYACGNRSQVSSKLDGECVPQIDKFFDQMTKKNYDSALDSLLSSNKFINTRDSNALVLRQQFKFINEFAGPYIAYKLIKKRNINDDIGVYSYLVKYEKKFYRFVFIFYRATDKPKIYKFLFDDSMDVELEESLKLYTN